VKTFPGDYRYVSFVAVKMIRFTPKYSGAALGLGIIALGMAVTADARAESVQIAVYTTLSPNAFGSPSYDAWVGNAITSLEGALATNTTPGTVGGAGPSQFQLMSIVNPEYLTVTGFPSWLGTADPGTAFGPAFANELGNRGSFPLIINGNGTQFSISELSFTATSSDPTNSLGFSFAEGEYDYNSNYVGIEFNGNPNTPADWTLITGGANNQMVDALVGRGSGNALWPCQAGVDFSPCSTTADQQADINTTAAILSGQTFTGTYSLDVPGGATGSATITATPEPSTFILMGFSGLALFAGRKRMKFRS
jgi:hypothetical protein